MIRLSDELRLWDQCNAMAESIGWRMSNPTRYSKLVNIDSMDVHISVEFKNGVGLNDIDITKGRLLGLLEANDD